jgi:hypothetical protein
MPSGSGDDGHGDGVSASAGNGVNASTSDGGQAFAAQRDTFAAKRDVFVDQSQHFHDESRDDELIPVVRMITAEDFPGFVGRADELARVASMLTPGAARGGPIVLYPDNRQPGIGVTSLAVQAASTALRAGWFRGGAVLVSPHAGGEHRQLALDRTLANVLDQLGVPPAGRTTGSGVEQAVYQRAMDALAADGKPVLIVVEEVWDSDAPLVERLRLARGPHRTLLTAWEPKRWMDNPRRVPVRYLNEDESVDVLASVLSTEGGSVRAADPSAHVRVLARCCRGVARALRRAADELAARPELSVAGLVQALADTYDRGSDAPVPVGQPASLNQSLTDMVNLLTKVWGPPPELDAVSRPFIGRRALLTWLMDDFRTGRSCAWDVIAAPGSGKSELLAAAQAALAAAGARAVVITMDVPVDSYERRLAGDSSPLVIELARFQLCREVARAVGEKLAYAENLAIDEHIYLADQNIRGVLATSPESQPDLSVGDLLIPRRAGEPTPPLDPAISEDYAERVRAVRLELGRRIADVLSRPAAAAGRLAILIDNLHLVTDGACRQWLADLFFDQLGAITVVTRHPGDQVFCDAAVPYHLNDFTPAEILEYLEVAGRIDPQWIDDRTLDAIVGLTHGRPQAVAVRCEELTGRLRGTISRAVGHPSFPAVPEQALGRPLAESSRSLVREACQEVLGRNLPIVMDFLAVLRHVNAGLLGEVLAAEGVTRDQASALAARLAKNALMTGSDDDDPESFRLHDHIRWYWLEDLPPDTQRRRHEVAEQVYSERVAGYEPEWDPQSGAAFTVWARFESPEFQGLLREWLFHAMRSQGRHLSPRTGVRITQVFLEAFAWWGWYLPFDVCEQLLREFSQISADKSEADQQWLADLSTFYRNYRLGFVYGRQEQRDWAKVGPAVEELRNRAGLATGRATDRGRRSIDVVTSIYLAQATAFPHPGGNPEAAAARFAEARAAVRRSIAAGHRGHAWYDAWIVYFAGDMWSSCGRPDKAAAALRELDAQRAADAGGLLFDRDLIIRVTNLQGEVYLALGDDVRAIDACIRGALLAYAYHVSQETREQPPNRYTYTAHLEAVARARACLAEVRLRDPAAWRAGIARMRATFAPYWRLAGGPAAGQYIPPEGPPPADSPVLPEGIIPPPPPQDYLGRLTTPFTELAKRVVYELHPFQDSWVPFHEPGPESQ